jgi:hypothetical protein
MEQVLRVAYEGRLTMDKCLKISNGVYHVFCVREYSSLDSFWLISEFL